MSNPSYFTKYRNFAMSRDDEGVLLVRLHTDGGPAIFTGETHRDLPSVMEDISLDGDNKAMVLTGTGDVFMTRVDSPTLGPIFQPNKYQSTIRFEKGRGLQRLLELPFPVVGVANGPATLHTELLLLCDLHIASDRATFGDETHPAGAVPAGDGAAIVWEEVLGIARAKWLLWTGASFDAKTALDWGVISEIVPHEKAVDRGLDLARQLARLPYSYLVLQKETLNVNLRRRLLNDLPLGTAHQSMALADMPYRSSASSGYDGGSSKTASAPAGATIR